MIEAHGIAVVASEVEAGLDPHLYGIDQSDREAAAAACKHRDVLGRLGKGHAARAAGKAAVGMERDAVLGASGCDGHLGFGRGDPGLREQPARQHGFGERHRDRKPPGCAEHAKTFGKARARAAAVFAHPGQRQAGFGQRLPQRRFPRAVFVAIDGLGVGEIGKNLLRGRNDDILTLRHGVPRY